jgi:hypothetical protein
MNNKTEQKLIGYGCLAVLIGILVCFYLANEVHWIYAVVALGLIGLGRILIPLHEKCGYRIHLEILEQAFVKSGLPLPEFQYSDSHGFPHFTLTFPSEADLNLAEMQGCVTAFKQSIQELYKHRGGTKNPFDVERSVWCTYVGWQFPPDAFDHGKPNVQP